MKVFRFKRLASLLKKTDLLKVNSASSEFNPESYFELMTPGVYRINTSLIPRSIYRDYDDAVFSYEKELTSKGALVQPVISMLDSEESVHMALSIWLASAKETLKVISDIHGTTSEEYTNAQSLVIAVRAKRDGLASYDSFKQCMADSPEFN